MAVEMFPGMTVMSLSKLIKTVFPNTSKKRRGRDRATHIVGIEVKTSHSGTMTSSALQNNDLSGTLTSSPHSDTLTSFAISDTSISANLTISDSLTPVTLSNTSTSASTLAMEASTLTVTDSELQLQQSLEQEIVILRRRLEERSDVQNVEGYKQKLASEMDKVRCSKRILVNGPDTVEHFE